MSKDSSCKSVNVKSVLFISMLIYAIVCFGLGALGKNPFHSILYDNTSVLIFFLILAISNLLIHYIIKRKFAYVVKKNPDVEYYHIVWHIFFLGYVMAWLANSMSSAVLVHTSLIIFAIPIAILIWEFSCRFIRKGAKEQIEDRTIDKREKEPVAHSSNIKSLSSKRWSSSFMTIAIISTLIMPIVGVIIGIHGVSEIWGNRKQGKILLIISSTLTVIYIFLFFLFFFDKQAVKSLLLIK
ncbi:hypothetical protein KAI19_02640 [bacterium]|nr:hypothetical protein [bacterium]